MLPVYTETPAQVHESPWRTASMLVRAYTQTAVYAVDNDGYPTSASICDMLKAATKAQVDYWQATGTTPGAHATDETRVASSKRLGPAQVTYGDTDALITQRDRDANTLCLEARLILDPLHSHPRII